MKKILISIGLVASLSACAMQTSPMTAGQLAHYSADQIYTNAVNIGIQRVQSGKLSSAKFHEFETAAWAALQLVKTAATSADLILAQKQLTTAVNSLQGGQ